jgi:hypothetical protein
VGDRRHRIAAEGKVALTGQLDQDGTGNQLGQGARAVGDRRRLLLAVDDERRRADRREGSANVHRPVHLLQRPVRPRVRPREIHVDHRGEVDGMGAGQTPFGQLAHFAAVLPGMLGPEGARLAHLLLGHPASVIRGEPVPRHRAPEDQAPATLRVGSREQRGHRAAVGSADQCSPFRPCRIHHRPDVVHPLLDVWNPHPAVGHAGPPLVEHDHAAERREPLEERRPGPDLPLELDVRDQGRREDHVERPLAEHLVRDPHVAAQGITRLWHHHRDACILAPGSADYQQYAEPAGS